jgi:AbrB family looped-hinge helix DNA binding protein
MTTAAITSKNQLTLPKEVRTKLGVGVGDSVVFEQQADGSFRLRANKSRDWREMVGSLNHLIKKGAKPVSVEEIDKAIGDYIAADHRRIFGK